MKGDIMGTNDSFHEGLKAYREARYSDAIELLRAAVTENEEDHKAWNALGVTYSKIGDTRKAIESYNTALKYDPGNESYIRNRDQIPQDVPKQTNRRNMKEIFGGGTEISEIFCPVHHYPSCCCCSGDICRVSGHPEYALR